MDKEYVGKETLLDKIGEPPLWNEYFPPYPFEAHITLVAAIKEMKKFIKEQPAADVELVRHGVWLPDYEVFIKENGDESEPIQTGWVCSLCGRGESQKEPYCNCGAKMDGKEE